MSYATELVNKKFKTNVVIKFIGEYFAIRQPDSGLAVPVANDRTVRSLLLNPTSVDLKRVNQTIANYSFRLVDRNNVITALVRDRASALVGEEVEIWVGRSGVNMDFADYFKLPKVKIKKISHNGNDYHMSCTENTDRMNKTVFSLTNKLAVNILSGTTTFTFQNDITAWPTAGAGRLDNEFISWTGKNNGTKQITGVVRGERNTFPASHDQGADVYNVVDIQDNPINILLKMLISVGGGGTYDTLTDGLGIDQNLVDISQIEALRDEIFPTATFKFALYNIPSALRFFEEEILAPCNLRFKVTDNSKIGLALLDQAVFGAAPNTIDENSIASYPDWSVDDNKIVNQMLVDYDWDEGTQTYQKQWPDQNAQSILDFGARDVYSVKYKGVQSSLGGDTFVAALTQRFLTRFGTPNPEITFKSHIDKHLQNIGDKTLLASSQIPTALGNLNFATELEVISRGINFETGDVTFKLAFTSYSGIRGCYIAPSDLLDSVINQKTITVPAGRGAYYTVGWRLVLWDHINKQYFSDPYNTIESIVGDTITFVNNFTTTLIAGDMRLKFPDYDDAVEEQHRYCFISDSGLDFADGSSTYRVLF